MLYTLPILFPECLLPNKFSNVVYIYNLYVLYINNFENLNSEYFCTALLYRNCRSHHSHWHPCKKPGEKSSFITVVQRTNDSRLKFLLTYNVLYLASDHWRKCLEFVTRLRFVAVITGENVLNSLLRYASWLSNSETLTSSLLTMCYMYNKHLNN